MFGSIFAGCASVSASMWAVTTALRIIAIVVALMRLKRE
jgi:hypothetical protein